MVEVRRDEVVAGGVFERPGLAAAIDDLEGFNGDRVLVVDSVNRLARDMLVTLTIQHEVEKNGARVEYANGTTPAKTPEGRLFGNVLAAFAAYERDRIRHSTSRGIKRRQENGEWFGRPPLGWMRDPENSKKLLPCEPEQKAVKMARELSRLGHPSHQIAQFLTEECGLFRGKPRSARTVSKIVASQASEGESSDGRP